MPLAPANTTWSPWPHRWAIALCCATFALICVGALVTTLQAGMAVPDWPTTYGYNMFLYPWETWIYGPLDLLVEHGHRLLGSLAGMLTIGLLVSVVWTRRPAWMIWLAALMLVAVISQGVLGGLRVLLNERQLAMIHGTTGPLFFALSAMCAVLTSRRWWDQTQPAKISARPTFAAAIITVGMVHAQIILGALVRHIPLDASPAFFRLLVLFHVLVGLALAVQIALVSGKVLTRHRGQSWLTRPAALLAIFTSGQLLLGIATWIVKYSYPSQFSAFDFAAGYTVTAGSLLQSMTVTAHVAMGSLILATSAVLAVRAHRLTSPATPRPFEFSAQGLAA
jgi:cytochrome c oxidase assembly protein subunit 15